MTKIISTDDKKFSYAINLEQDILFAVESINLDKIKEILNKEDEHLVSKNFKEKMTFLRACVSFNENRIDVLKYLIFDYKISEENARNNVADKNPDIQEMLYRRKVQEIHSELAQELSNNDKEFSRKPKV